MNRKAKIMVLLLVDTLLIASANVFSYYYVQIYVKIPFQSFLNAFIIQVLFYVFFGFVFHVFTRINRYTSLRELISIFAALTCASVLEIIVFSIKEDAFSRRHTLLTYLLSLFLIATSRICWKFLVDYVRHKGEKPLQLKNTLIVGAGSGGEILVNALKSAKRNQGIHMVGFVDDDKDKTNTILCGQKVLGTTKDLPKLIKEYDIKMITLAAPSMPPKKVEGILDTVNPYGVEVNAMPTLAEIASGKVSVTKLREVQVTDLLGREEIQLENKSIMQQIEHKTILVTGAGGSIGSEICRQLIHFHPKQLLLLGHGENSIYTIEKELKVAVHDTDIIITSIIADVQDKNRIENVMQQYHPDIVYHAAAHKHVPLMEGNPTEAVKNNVFGTQNVAELSKKYKVSSFVMISTDKAVKPPNVMGATKRIAEMIVTGLNEEGQTKFSAVRFGNVLGSRGSVVPLFKEQIAKGGPVTVTDFRMIRYFMTIPEASQLVIQAGALANGGEIFILDMGEPVKIYDLAKKMVKLSGFTESEIPIVEAGIRPGEKLYEELLVDKERAQDQVHDRIFVGNVNGFTYEEVQTFLQNLPKEEHDLAKTLVNYAKESSRC